MFLDFLNISEEWGDDDGVLLQKGEVLLIECFPVSDIQKKQRPDDDAFGPQGNTGCESSWAEKNQVKGAKTTNDEAGKVDSKEVYDVIL